MQWINVKDRLPEYQAYCGSERFAHVIVSVNGCVGQGMFCNGRWEFLGLKNVAVSHWTPLPEPPSEYEDIEIEDLNLSNRTMNCLKNAEIKTLGELKQKTEKELLKINSFGKKCLREVVDLLLHFDCKTPKENPYLKAFYDKSTEGL